MDVPRLLHLELGQAVVIALTLTENEARAVLANMQFTRDVLGKLKTGCECEPGCSPRDTAEQKLEAALADNARGRLRVVV